MGSLFGGIGNAVGSLGHALGINAQPQDPLSAYLKNQQTQQIVNQGAGLTPASFNSPVQGSQIAPAAINSATPGAAPNDPSGMSAPLYNQGAGVQASAPDSNGVVAGGGPSMLQHLLGSPVASQPVTGGVIAGTPVGPATGNIPNPMHDLIPAPTMPQTAAMNEAAGPGQTPVHKGLLGIHGTLRDIIGTIGDAFLTQSGHAPIYAQQRVNENAQDAYNQMGQPQLAAIAHSNPALAAQIQNNNQTFQSSMYGHQVTQANQVAEQRAKAQQYLGGLIYAAKDNPAGYVATMQVAKNYAAAHPEYGLDLSQYPSDINTPAKLGQMMSAANGSSTVNQQRGADYKDVRADQFATQIENQKTHYDNSDATAAQRTKIAGANQGESVRHHQVTEGQGAVRNDIANKHENRLQASAPVRVNNIGEAQALKPGTRYVTPDNQIMTR